jgi:DNA-binding GntR family transcriptional regulator
MDSRKLTVKRKTLGDEVYNYLKDSIITLRLKPGQMVYESELAASLGVSRTPIREAFRILSAEELIEILPQRGVRISNISRKKVMDAWFVRSTLENEAIKKIAETWDPGDEYCRSLSQELRELIATQRHAAVTGDYATFLKCDIGFHNRLLDYFNNPTLTKMVMFMRSHVNRVLSLEQQEIQEFDHIIGDHEKILHAIEKNDVKGAEYALKVHFGRLMANFQKLVSQYPDYFVD